MKKLSPANARFIFTVTILLYLSFEIYAQPTPVELMTGHQYLKYQHMFRKPFHDQSSLGFVNAFSVQSYYNPAYGHEVMSQSYITYRIIGDINFAAGYFYATGVGVHPSVSVQIVKKLDHFLFVVVPRADVYDKPSFEIMTMIEARTGLTAALNLYARLNAMSNYSKKGHNRSFQNFVIGIEKKNIQFGIAASFDEYGEAKTTLFNAGVFVKQDIH